jgi:hypothetical protein
MLQGEPYLYLKQMNYSPINVVVMGNLQLFEQMSRFFLTQRSISMFPRASKPEASCVMLQHITS